MKNGPIILIDDDIDDQEFLTEMLLDMKVQNEIIRFIDGAQALAYLQALRHKADKTAQPFLIISDINMPVMDGLELRRQIQRDAVLKKMSIPFVYLSTSNSQQNIEEVYEMDVQGYFEKSYQTDLMQSMMGQIYHYWQLCRHPNN